MPSVIIICIWLCAYLNCAGWILSAIHQLNKTGYIFTFVIGLGALWWWRKTNHTPPFPKFHLPKYQRRFKKLFPLSFLVLAVLAGIGGALYAPANFDTLAYRTPRVLHWLAAGQWEWIHTEFHRLNTRSAGFEWLTAPLFLFTGTDRLEFLLNLLAFALLPGRVFAVLTLLGVRSRTAWHWMWLFPAGYGYVLQAGSVVNDLFGSLLALAAFEFALRGSRGKNLGWLLTSALAASLMTAVKTFNLVLLLPWFIAILPGIIILLRRPVLTFAVAVLGVGASMLPTAFLNAHYCHDWTGATLEQTPVGGGREFLRFVGNTGSIAVSNFQPPVFPFVKQWDDFVKRAIPEDFAIKLRSNMEGGLARFQVMEVQVEESAGLGFGVSLLLLVVALGKLFFGRGHGGPPLKKIQLFVLLAMWFSFLVLITRAGYVGPARYLLPFYVLLLVPGLAGNYPAQLTRRRWWQPAGLLVFASALLVLVLSPQRPLWPANTILQALGAEQPENFLRHRALAVYDVYGQRAKSFDAVIQKLPPGLTILGFIGFDEPEATLWQPFGSRRIKNICHADSAADIRARGIKYALVSVDSLQHNLGVDFDAWLQQVRGQQVAAFPLKIRAGRPITDWRLVNFSDN